VAENELQEALHVREAVVAVVIAISNSVIVIVEVAQYCLCIEHVIVGDSIK